MMIPPDPDMLKVLHDDRVRRLRVRRWNEARFIRNHREQLESLHFDRHGRLR